MNTTLVRALVVLVPVLAFAVWSGSALTRTPTPGTRLRFIGAMCLVVVVLTHVAEALNALPFMHWGSPDSVGHYLDLVSAIAGVTLTASGLLLQARERVRPHR